jgi:type IV pilus assembly protein PilN
MIHINLLPVRQIKQRLQIRNEVAIYGASLLLLFFVIGSTALGQKIKIEDLTVQNQILTTKKASYQPILNEIEKLKKDRKEQETKLDVIKKLKTGSQITVHVMDELAKLTPTNRLWFNSLNQSGESVSINGIALDNATIAQFMQSITESSYFSGAELSQTSQTTISGAKLKSFAMKIGITPPNTNQEKAATVEKK